VEDLEDFLGLGRQKTVLPVPYALKDMTYSPDARARFKKSGHRSESIHEEDDPAAAVNDAEVFFTMAEIRFRW